MEEAALPREVPKPWGSEVWFAHTEHYAGDWSSAHGIPAHITIAGPWPLSVSLPLEALGELGREMNGARLILDRIGTLGDALCLLPEDDSGLLRWRASVLEAVGLADSLYERWCPHLTVCRGPEDGTADAIQEALGEALPLDCEVRGLLLAQKLGDSAVRVRPL
jgi:hypothetical protein